VAGGMREGACAGHMFAMSCSIPPLPLARDRRRSRILDLQPAVGARGPVRRSQLLRYDALTAKRAGVAVDNRAVCGGVLVEWDPRMFAPQQPVHAASLRRQARAKLRRSPIPLARLCDIDSVPISALHALARICKSSP
jgi:hypothetical protein